MYKQFDHNTLQVDFLKITDSIYYEEEFKKNGSRIFNIPNRRNNPFAFYFALIKFFRNNNDYDVVHHHLNSCSSIEPIIIAKLFGVKTVAHSHNEFKGNKRLTNLLHKLNRTILPYFTDSYIACSDKAGESMFKKNKFNVINNGVNLKEYTHNQNTRGNYRELLDIKNKFVVGHIGRFKYQKNHEYLIEVFYEFQKLKDNSVLMLVGEGELEKDIREKVQKLGIEDKVLFTGVRNDISSLMQAMDAFVFPSRYEGLGIVLIEAQAAGLYSLVADTIPDEALVTNLISKKSLNDTAKDWARVLLQNSCYIRSSDINELSKKGFDRSTAANELIKIYNNLIK